MSATPAARAPGTAAASAAAVTGFMTLAYAVNIMNQGLVLVAAEQIKLDFALSNAELGFVIGLSYMLTSAIGAVPLGRLADVWSRSRLVGWSLGLMGLASALTSTVQSYASLIALRALAGTGDAGVLPGAVSMISGHVSVARRPFALSVFNAGAAVGALLVYLVMGWVIEDYGWRTAYLTVGVLGALVGMLVWLGLPDRRAGSEAPAAAAGSLRAVAELARLAPYRHIVLAFIAFGLTSSATWNWLSPVLQRTYGFSVAEAGALLGLGSGIAVLLGSLFFGVLASRLRQRSVCGPVWAAAGMKLASAGCFIGGLAQDAAQPMMLLIAGGYFFASSGMVVVFSTIQEVVPPQRRGLAVGCAVLLFSLLGHGLGPIVTGLATDSLTAEHGDNALRVAMQFAMALGAAWICLHLWQLARSLQRLGAGGRIADG